MMPDEPYTIDDPNDPPKPGKRYGLSCDGRSIGSFDTLQEVWDAWKHDEKLILPVLKKNNKRVRGQYAYRDGRKEMTFEQFRMALQREKSKGGAS